MLIRSFQLGCRPGVAETQARQSFPRVDLDNYTLPPIENIFK